MDPIKEALTFDDVLLSPNYSEVLPSEVSTNTSLSKNLKASENSAICYYPNSSAISLPTLLMIA